MLVLGERKYGSLDADSSPVCAPLHNRQGERHLGTSQLWHVHVFSSKFLKTRASRLLTKDPHEIICT